MNKVVETVPKEYDEKKIREFLKESLQMSTRFVRKAAIDKRILVDGQKVKLDYVLKEGQTIEIILDKKETQDILPEKMDLEVVYEDDNILVVNKPPFMVVHPTKSHPTGTLANGVIGYFREKGDDSIVRLVSRLDMNTSGLIIIAKNQFSHMALSRDMKEDTFKKIYLAIVHGHMAEESGTIDLPIYRPTEDAIKRIVDERGQESITHYKVLETYDDAQLLMLELETGRTHQIRIHLSHLGCPIFGDTLYGTEDEEFIGRQALHAHKLEIPHPKDGKVIGFQCHMPEDMEELIKKLKKN